MIPRLSTTIEYETLPDPGPEFDRILADATREAAGRASASLFGAAPHAPLPLPPTTLHGDGEAEITVVLDAPPTPRVRPGPRAATRNAPGAAILPPGRDPEPMSDEQIAEGIEHRIRDALRGSR